MVGCVSAVLAACGAGRRPVKAMGEKKGGTHFSQCVLGSVEFGSRLGYVHFSLASQSMDGLKRTFGFLCMSRWWVSVRTGAGQGVGGSAELNSHGSALRLPCPCSPSVTAAVGPGRLSPLGLLLNLPPGWGRPPIAEEDVSGSRLAGAGTITRGLTP